MPEIKGDADDYGMPDPPAEFVAHEVPEHLSPPENVSEKIDQAYADEVDYPPAWFQKTYLVG